jgi:lipopolysaccharide transport system ATP-binding protein
MAAVLSLCKRALLLEAGQLALHGSTQEVVQRYVQSALGSAARLDQRSERSGDGSVRACSLRIESADGDPVIRPSSRLRVAIGYRSAGPLRYARFLVKVCESSHTGIFLLDSDAAGAISPSLPATGEVTCVTDPINLTPGRCYVNLQVLRGGVVADAVEYAGAFDVVADDFYGSGKLPRRDKALCLLRQRWSSETVEARSQAEWSGT